MKKLQSRDTSKIEAWCDIIMHGVPAEFAHMGLVVVDEIYALGITAREYHENVSDYWRWCLGVGRLQDDPTSLSFGLRASGMCSFRNGIAR